MSDSFYEVGDKFLIEIGEIYKSTAINENEGIITDEQENAPEFLYRIKGFNNLVFDEDKLFKFKKYNDKSNYISPEQVEKIKEESKNEGLEEGLLQGRQEMLNIVRKILISDLNGGFHINELRKIFGTDNRCDIIQNSAEDIVYKINEYEQKKANINEDPYSIVPGDIVTIDSDCTRAIVLNIDVFGSNDSDNFEYHVFTEVGTCETIPGKYIQFAGMHSKDYDNIVKSFNES